MAITGVYFIPTSPNATTTLSTLTERLRASFTDEDLIPIGRWFLDHKLMRDTPGLLPPQAGQHPTKPRYMQLLSLSHYPTHGFIYTSESTEKPLHAPAAATSPASASTPAASATSPGSLTSAQAASTDTPMVMTTVPPASYKTLFQHFTYACQPFWCHRLTVAVPNGVVYDVRDFRVRMGDVRQTFPSVRARGTIVEIEWRGPSVVDSLSGVRSGVGTDSSIDAWFCALEDADIDAEYGATASLIREFWSRLGIDGAREAIVVPGVGKEVKEKLARARKEMRGGESKAGDEGGLFAGLGGVQSEDDIDPTAGTDVARQYMEVLRFNR